MRRVRASARRDVRRAREAARVSPRVRASNELHARLRRLLWAQPAAVSQAPEPTRLRLMARPASGWPADSSGMSPLEARPLTGEMIRKVIGQSPCVRDRPSAHSGP
jgi:hypothetical protein